LVFERRKNDRYCFNLDLQPDGELLILKGDRTFEIWKLVDISPFGACLSTDAQFNAGSKIALRYRFAEDEITVAGTVTWNSSENSQEEGAGFRLGVDFDRDRMVLNAALFTALTD